MKYIFFGSLCFFFLLSCSSEPVNIIEKELENKNIPSSDHTQTINTMKNDFQKDLDTLFNDTGSGSSE